MTITTRRSLFVVPVSGFIRYRDIITARVRSTREGNVLTRVCPSINLSVHRGGVPISHNALQHFPECHEAAGGPSQVPPRGRYLDPPPGGYPDPPWGVPGPPWGVPPRGVPRPPRGVPGPPGGYLTGYPPGGYLTGGVPDWVPPRGVPGRVLPPRGVPDWVPPGGYLTGYPPGGVPDWGDPGQVPPGQVRMGGVPCWGWGGYPGRTTEGVLTTRRAVCLLRSCRRTFLL